MSTLGLGVGLGLAYVRVKACLRVRGRLGLD